MEKTYNIVELFSGIGSQAAALKNLGVKINTVGTSEWDVHAIVAYDMIHGGTDIPADIARMSKDELLEKMSHYTFSNSGKAPLEYEALRTYSVESLRYIYTSIRRNHNFVDISAGRKGNAGRNRYSHLFFPLSGSFQRRCISWL